VEVDLVAQASIGALEVSCELAAQLRPRGEGPLGQVHGPRLGRISQGHRKIVSHDFLIPSCSEDRGGVDLQKLEGVDTLIVLLWQVGLELVRLDHHAEVRDKCHTTSPRSHQGCSGASRLPHRGGVHRIELPIEVATLTAVPLPLALDGDAVVLNRATALEISQQIRRSETYCTYCRRHMWCHQWA
jgi:hypothetical protein